VLSYRPTYDGAGNNVGYSYVDVCSKHRLARRFRTLSLMLSDALESFIQIFSPPFRKVMWKSLGFTAMVLFLLGLGLDRLASSLMPVAPTWLSWIFSVLVALGLIASLILLAAPAVSLAAGFYLDDIADAVEREIDPQGARGRPLPLWRWPSFGRR
jgi:uncharacterized protein involved in cysteine biosynthesis